MFALCVYSSRKCYFHKHVMLASRAIAISSFLFFHDLFSCFLIFVNLLVSHSTMFSSSFLFTDLKLLDQAQGSFLALIHCFSSLSFQVYIYYNIYFYSNTVVIICNLLYHVLTSRYAFLPNLWKLKCYGLLRQPLFKYITQHLSYFVILLDRKCQTEDCNGISIWQIQAHAYFFGFQ